MRTGKLLAVIVGFLVCVSLFRAVAIDDPVLDDVHVYDVLVKLQQFDFDTSTLSALIKGIEELPDFPTIFDPDTYLEADGTFSANSFLLGPIIQPILWLVEAVKTVVVPLWSLFTDSIALFGEILSVVFSLLGFSFN